MGALAVIGIIYIIYKLISEACEKPWENVNYTSAQYQKDFDKVVVEDMAFKQLEKNVHAGKYSKWEGWGRLWQCMTGIMMVKKMG